MLKDFSSGMWAIAVTIFILTIGAIFINELNFTFEGSDGTKVQLNTLHKELKHTEVKEKNEVIAQKETLKKENIVKTLSIEESVQKYIDNFNNKNYRESFKFVKDALLNRDGFADKEGYIKYWNNEEATYDLQSINKDNLTFHVMMKLNKYNLVKKYKLHKNNNKWVIEKEIFKTKIKNGKIQYEGVDSKKIRYEATFNNHGSIIESYSKKIALGKDCDVNLYAPLKDKKWHKIDTGKWYQNDNGFIIEFKNTKKILFRGQEVMIMNHQCYK